MKFEKPDSEQLHNRYSYHAPKGNQNERYELIRKGCFELAKIIVNNSPACREQERALEELDKVMMLTNAAIARTE